MNSLVALTRRFSLATPVQVNARTAWVLAIGLGLALRVVHFARVPSLWHDEAVVLLSAFHLTFSQLFGPLMHSEAAPPLFLVVERCMMLLFGDSVLVFRALPFAAGCASMVLFARLAWRLLPSAAAVWATALFAVSDRLLWHAIEAKPYAIDVLVALSVAWGYVLTRGWPLWKQSLAALPVFPVVLWLSFPSCFVIGGWFLVQVPPLLRSRSIRDWAVSVLLAAAVATSFAALALGPVAAQRDASMESCWVNGFPNWNKPWTVPVWVARSTLDVFTYCIASQGWLLCGVFAVGVVQFVRRQEQNLVGLLLLPMGLTLFAALIGKYPYCGMRVLVFMTPAICLLTAAGIAQSYEWLRKQSRWGVLALAIFLAIPFLHTARRTIDPWPRAEVDRAVDWVLADWKDGDVIGFNNWQSEFYFHDRQEHWLTRERVNSATRIWYIADCPQKETRELLLTTVGGEWRVVDRREHRFVTVALFERVEP